MPFIQGAYLASYGHDMHQDVKALVKTCEACQKRDPGREEEALHPTWVSYMWQKVSLDIVHMPALQRERVFVAARDDFSGWPEARALRNTNAKSVARFI